MNDPTTVLCPGMPCRTAADNVVDDCGSVPGTEDSIQLVRDALAQFDSVGK